MEKTFDVAEAAGLRFVQKNQIVENFENSSEGLSDFSEKIHFRTTVTDTNFEAQAAKKTAVEHGYFEDEFIKHFIEGEYKEAFDAYNRRSYWLRLVVMRAIQNQFLRKVGDQSDFVERQVINLGCGFDTAAFMLLKAKSTLSKFTFFEFDLPVVAQKKAEIIKKTPEILALLEKLAHQSSDGLLINSNDYKLNTCDLNDLAALDSKLRSAGIDFSKPTLVVSEYVLPYIESKQITSLVAYFATHFSRVAMIDNGVTNLGDDHGKLILAFNQERNIPLPSFEFYFSPETLKTNYERLGFNFCLETMEKFYSELIDQQERRRVDRIEVLENPEFELAEMKHYFISLSKKFASDAQDQSCAPLERLSLSSVGQQ